MRPISRHPERSHGTARTHNFNSYDDINVEKLKVRTKISQVGTYTFSAAKVISGYVKLSCLKKYESK